METMRIVGKFEHRWAHGNSNNFLTTVENLPMNEATAAWYQHDGLPPYNGGAIADILEEIFDALFHLGL